MYNHHRTSEAATGSELGTVALTSLTPRPSSRGREATAMPRPCPSNKVVECGVSEKSPLRRLTTSPPWDSHDCRSTTRPEPLTILAAGSSFTALSVIIHHYRGIIERTLTKNWIISKQTYPHGTAEPSFRVTVTGAFLHSKRRISV
ncbi:uncharacterized protein EI97DRAFT_263284 [Westerdykella ornata]|uniref:Uncharacterized protein n=1 Tax=Westerdykella ornata TaxID=318751 RepID=A0A6A6J4S6_WESOR|nr:uncharacterized protein EI97DRAFT_263284 [Westerdykella ornata]KAF2271581.1 hypothetical protein EI97DRAFT_263284 [Westerdykella ornata]